jgi:hydrophobic/amphiphilic exporter-1 (mainly G- bacteria), HAE1 family
MATPTSAAPEAAPNGGEAPGRKRGGLLAQASGLPALALRRPWLVIVLNLLIVIAGLAALRGVEVRELPNIDRPVISIVANWPGAAAQTVDAEVTRQIEAAASRVAGVVAVRSVSREGGLWISLEFQPTIDMMTAAIDVREAISRVERGLPNAVEDLAVIKADADASWVMQLTVSSTTLAIDELSRVVEDRIEPALVAVPGVADVGSFGGRQRTLRVRLDPSRMAALGIGIDEVIAAVRSAPADVPAGTLKSTGTELLVRADASLLTPDQLRALPLRTTATGSSVSAPRLGDVADVHHAPADVRSLVRLDGRSVVSLGIVREAQANTLEISTGVRRVVDQLNAQGDGLEVRVVDDDAVFIEGALREVLITLVLAVIIVVAVVGVFLGSWRATLVPIVAMPIALIGTLAAIWMLGFSLNLITLLAMVLACGLVVDDAIVVLENIQRRRAMGLPPRAASVIGTREVFFAVMATTATLASVFVPISFLPSGAGRLFREFGFVMAIAVALSSFVALSLAPMIAARMSDPTREPSRVKRVLSRGGRAVLSGYRRSLGQVLRFGWVVVAASVLVAGLAMWQYQRLQQELVPQQDRGVVRVRLDGPDGVSLAYMDRQMELALQALEPLRAEGLVTQFFTITGRGRANQADIIAPLPPWGDRDFTQQQVAQRVTAALAGVPGVRHRIQGSSGLGIPGADGTVQMAITGDDHERIAAAAFELSEAAETELPNFRELRVNWRASQPTLALRIDRERAAELGVSVEALSSALRVMVEGFEVAELNADDRSIPVIIESQRRAATDPDDLLNLNVRTADGTLVSLAQFVGFSEGVQPQELRRFAQRRAVEINAPTEEGYPLGEAVEDVRELAQRVLPEGMQLLFRGEAAALDETSRDVAITFAIAMLVIFLVLVAQFEGVTSAAVVMITVPFGLAAAVFAMLIGGVSMNIYSQIGLLLLVGVMAKNSILMVEFADQLRDRGMTVHDAALESACVRLRPILMTMVSTILGALPLVLSSGAGAEARVAIGSVIFGGLGLAALFTLFLTPVIYLGLARFARPRAAQGDRLMAEMEQAEWQEQQAEQDPRDSAGRRDAGATGAARPAGAA